MPKSKAGSLCVLQDAVLRWSATGSKLRSTDRLLEYLVNSDEFVEAIVVDAGLEGLQAVWRQLEGHGPVTPGCSCQREIADARTNIEQHLQSRAESKPSDVG